MAPDDPLTQLPATFCILPWKSLQVRADGSTMICCKFNSYVSRDGAPLSVHRHTLEEIWNSEEVRAVRRAMSAGQPVAGCAQCYHEEQAGGVSMRTCQNQYWQEGWLNEEGQTAADLIAQTVRRDYRAPADPVSFVLELGNLCNLKCRMCNGDSSSRIARDPVHGRWVPAGDAPPGDPLPWYRRPEVLRGELLRRPDRLRHLYLLGGEPLLIKEVGALLQYLIDAGAAPNIVLQMATNAMTVNTPWLHLTGHFKQLHLLVSLDGHGEHLEYIRYPAKWDRVAANVTALQRLPNAVLIAHVTVQAYNALNLVELLRYCDRVGLSFQFNPLSYPPYLAVAVLPPRARQLAARRLRAYADGDCLPPHCEAVLALAAALESYGEGLDGDLLRQFMQFTNDLDVTRGQSFRRTHAELLGLIDEAGFEWTDETRHARGLLSLPLLGL